MSVLWYGLESLGEIARAEVEGAAAAALGRAGAAWQRARPKVATATATALAAVLTPPFVVGRLVLGLLDAYAPSRPVERWTVTVDGEEVPLAAPYMPALEAEAAAREVDRSVECGGGVEALAGQAAPEVDGAEPLEMDLSAYVAQKGTDDGR